MHERRAGSQCFDRIEHRRQGIVCDFDLFRGLLRAAQILGDNDRDQLAVETHFVERDEVLIIGDFELFVRRYLQTRIVAVEVIPIEHGQDARHAFSLGGVDADDARVRVRAVQRLAPDRAG